MNFKYLVSAGILASCLFLNDHIQAIEKFPDCEQENMLSTMVRTYRIQPEDVPTIRKILEKETRGETTLLEKINRPGNINRLNPLIFQEVDEILFPYTLQGQRAARQFPQNEFVQNQRITSV